MNQYPGQSKLSAIQKVAVTNLEAQIDVLTKRIATKKYELKKLQQEEAFKWYWLMKSLNKSKFE